MFQMKPATILLLLLQSTILEQTNAFATWLVDRPVGCFAYLEPGEIIMNSAVLSSSQSKNTDVSLSVYRTDSTLSFSKKILLEEVERMDNGDQLILLKEEEGSDFYYKVMMDMPSNVHDAQYVMDLHTIPSLKSTTEEEEEEESTLWSASFLGSNIGCEGKRAHGRQKKDDGLTIHISQTGTLNKDNGEDTVEIWGGWATDHEAVSLTPKVIFRLSVSDNDKNKESRKEEEESILIEETVLVEEDEEQQNLLREEQAKIAMKKFDDLRISMQHNLSPEEVHASQMGGDKTASRIILEQNHHNPEKRDLDTLVHSISTSSSYWYGAVLMLVYIGCFVKYAHVGGGDGMRFKGRRDL